MALTANSSCIEVGHVIRRTVHSLFQCTYNVWRAIFQLYILEATNREECRLLRCQILELRDRM